MTRCWLATFTFLMGVSFSAQADEVYRCVEKGVTKFSALPCGDHETMTQYDVSRAESIEDYWLKQKEKLQKKLDERQVRAEEYVEGYPSLNVKIKEAILECRITRGMTRKQVYLSWNILPEAERREVSRESSLTFYKYKRTPICRKDKFKEADLTFNNRTQLLVGWNIRH